MNECEMICTHYFELRLTFGGVGLFHCHAGNSGLLPPILALSFVSMLFREETMIRGVRRGHVSLVFL